MPIRTAIVLAGLVIGQSLLANEVKSRLISHKEDIRLSAQALVKHVTASGHTASEVYHYTIAHNQLEHIVNIEAEYVTPKGKTIQVKKKDFVHKDALTGTFYSGLELTHIPIPEFSSFVVHYTVEMQEPMLLGGLPFSSGIAAGNIEYTIQTEQPIEIRIDSAAMAECTDKLSLDTRMENDGLTKYVFSYNPDEEQEGFDYVRIGVKNGDLDESYEAAILRWHRTLLAGIDFDGSVFFSEMKEQMPQAGEEAYEDSCLSFIQEKLQYIDIENGLGAFCPRSPALIWEAKKGDCKDMSFFIHSLLSDAGITSYLALSASSSHHSDMDFPSVSSANHMICVVPNEDGSYTVLDATDDKSSARLPSRHTQGRQILIMKDQPEYYRIPDVDARQNLEQFTIDLDLESLTGKFEAVMHGYAAMSYADVEDSKGRYKRVVERFKHRWPSANLSIDSIVEQEGQVLILGDIAISKKTSFSMDGLRYVKLGFLPSPWELLEYDSLTSDIPLFRQRAVETTLLLSSSNEFEVLDSELPISDLHLSEAEFETASRRVDQNAYQLSYRFQYNQSRVERDKNKDFVRLNEQMNQFLRSYVQIR